MHNWITNLGDIDARAETAVLMTVAAVRGSAPREIGAKMIVTATESIGTIGGGQLEYQCVRIAARQVSDGSTGPVLTTTRRFVLGANCGQCCGGVVEVMFEALQPGRSKWLGSLDRFRQERIPVVMATSPGHKFLITADCCSTFGDLGECPPAVLTEARSMLAMHQDARMEGDFLLEPVRESSFDIALFGAGHVGAATVDILSRLDCNIRWIDSREKFFPTVLAGNVTAVESANPAREVESMPRGSWFLIMTHSHPIDQEVCAQVLRREDFAYCGLIGSKSKRRRFERRMVNEGMPESLLERLVCPIGVSGIHGKKPVEIAIAVAAELLQVRDALLKEQSEFNSGTKQLRAC